MHQILDVVIVLSVLSVVFGTLQMLWPAVADMRRSWRELATDSLYWLFTPLVTKPLASAVVVICLLPVLWLLGRSFDLQQLRHGFGPVGSWPGWMQFCMVLVLGDFIGYWVHRALHRGVLWRFHAVHHGARELTWMSALRSHPVNDVISRTVQAIPFVALGFSPTVIAGYVPFLSFYAVMLHANLRWDFGPMRFVLASPAFHRWHHADAGEARDRNFAGLLPLWDWMFGTLYLPHREHAQSFGAQGEIIPPGFLAQLAFPFRRQRVG